MVASIYKKIMLVSVILCISNFSFAQKIVSYQYWFDNNVASAQSVNVSSSGPVASINATINTSSLSKGYHSLMIQFKDKNNNYGVPLQSLFVIGNADITAYEYWVDFDYGTVVSASVSPTQLLDLSTTLDLSKLSEGTHYLLMHYKDANNTWSSMTIDTISVVTGIAPVSALNTLSLNPTLTSGMVQLSGLLKTPGKLTIQIYNSLGVKVGEEELRSVSQVNESFNLESFSPGAYYMVIRQSEDYIVKKFVKQF